MSLPAHRLAVRPDAEAITRIYNEGIADHIATFETALRSTEDILGWFERRQPLVVVEAAGSVIAFAASWPSSARACYAQNAEFSVYVAREWRGRGAGAAAMLGLIEAARAAGLSKLVSGVFPENAPSRRLLGRMGFREVGTYARHGQLDGQWRDVIIVERLLA